MVCKLIRKSDGKVIEIGEEYIHFIPKGTWFIEKFIIVINMSSLSGCESDVFTSWNEH